MNFSPKGRKQGERKVSIPAGFEFPGFHQQVQQRRCSRAGHANDEHGPVGFRQLRGQQALEFKAGGLDHFGTQHHFVEETVETRILFLCHLSPKVFWRSFSEPAGDQRRTEHAQPRGSLEIRGGERDPGKNEDDQQC